MTRSDQQSFIIIVAGGVTGLQLPSDAACNSWKSYESSRRAEQKVGKFNHVFQYTATDNATVRGGQ